MERRAPRPASGMPARGRARMRVAPLSVFQHSTGKLYRSRLKCLLSVLSESPKVQEEKRAEAPVCQRQSCFSPGDGFNLAPGFKLDHGVKLDPGFKLDHGFQRCWWRLAREFSTGATGGLDRKSTPLNSSHLGI